MSVEEEIFELLKANDLSVSTAESCTGGMVASRLVNVPGISAHFEEGFITYSDRAKREILKVAEETLNEYTAVSVQTAEKMAYGAAMVSGADAAVSTTGYAGPDAGPRSGEVGLVCIGCCVHGNISACKYIFAGDRQSIREQTTDAALEFLKLNLCKWYK